LKKIIIEFLCRNRDKGFSSKEISQALSLKEEDINYTMLKLGISDFLFELTKGLTRRDNNNITGKTKFRIEDVTVNGITYYRCSKVGRDPSKNGIRKFNA
jgi:DNA-binding transcriptional MerR regulator